MKKSLKILLVEDDEDDYFLTKELLKETGQNYELTWAPVYDEALEMINTKSHDVYLIDYRLGKNSGLDVLNYITSKEISSPAIILTGQGDPRIDLQAMHSGAADYLVKGTFDASTLERTIRYATEQAALVRMLRENENKYRNVFEKSRDIIFMMNRDGKVLDINSAAMNIFGYQDPEIFDFGKRNFFATEEDYKLIHDAFTEGKEIYNGEISFVSKTGNKIPCILNTTLLDKERGIYMGICHDISERKKIEETQRSADKFIASGRIARTLAHEVRNPLTNINLAVEQLEQDNSTLEDRQMLLDLISRNSDRINNLVTQMLQSTKFEELGLRDHNLNELIEEALDEAKDRIQLKGIRVKKEFSPDICSVRIDPEKMKIAILNIIINAIEAMENSAGTLEITTRKEEDKCIITIHDNGPGIKPEDLDQLFVPFFTNKPHGTGLGLTTAQNIILNHKGTLRVNSERGKGATFTIVLKL
ncbi:MAG TPA: ATP-binding protein [Chitinophagales bacterium]|nr:ATP-binding protein [Chitinophagales bacterium]